MEIFSHFRKSTWVHVLFRVLQIIDGIVIIGMYGQDLARAMKASKYADGKWVFAVVIGSLATFTALVFAFVSMCVQYRTVALLFFWEWAMTISFAVLSGIFGSMYFKEKTEMEAGIARMKQAAGFDLAGVFLWLISSVFATWWFFSERRKQFRPRREIPDGNQWQGNAGLAVPKGSVSSMSSRSFRR